LTAVAGVVAIAVVLRFRFLRRPGLI